MLRIGIDARPLHWPGIGRHIKELLRHLCLIDAENEYYIYFSSQQYLEENRVSKGNFHEILLPAKVYSISEQVHLPLRIARDRLDIFHCPSSLVVPLVHPCKLVVTVHDIMLKAHPEFIPSRTASVYFDIMNWRALSSAKKLITVSGFTRDEILSHYPKYREKITVIHNGVHKRFRPVQDINEIERVKRALGASGGYVLYLGTYKKHKNLTVLIKAYANLPQSIRAKYQLLIAGKRDQRYPEVPDMVRALGIGQYVIYADSVCDEDLPALYSGASCFVLPSVYEGFGLPLIEAMACGTPAVASRIPVFEEIAGDAAAFASPHDSREMSSAILKVLNEKEYGATLRSKGLLRTERFSWLHAAKKVKEVYESI